MTGAVTVNVSIDVPDLASGLRFYGIRPLTPL